MRKLALVSLALALGACQTTSPTYQAASTPAAAGYYTAPVGDGREAVIYTGSKGMKPGQVAEYALLRAAEYTLENGNEWFAVLHTQTDEVTQGQLNQLSGKSGSVLSTGSTSTGAGGGGDRSTATPGVDDGYVPTGPSTGGFGGGDVPYQVLERWNEPTVSQTTLLIQMGSGDDATFAGLETTPEVYSAQEVRDQIRAKMGG